MADQTQNTNNQSWNTQTTNSSQQNDLNLNLDFGNIPDATTTKPEEVVEVKQESNSDLDLSLNIPEKTETITPIDTATEIKEAMSETTGQTKIPELILDLPQVSWEIKDEKWTENKETKVDESAIESTQQVKPTELMLDLPPMTVDKKEEDRLKNEDNNATTEKTELTTNNLNTESVTVEKPIDLTNPLDVSKFPTQTPQQVLSQFSETQSQVPEISNQVQQPAIQQPAQQSNYISIDSLPINSNTNPVNLPIQTPVQIPVQQDQITTPNVSRWIDLDAMISQSWPLQIAIPVQAQNLQSNMINSENILGNQLNNVYQTQPTNEKTGKFKWVKIFILFLLVSALWVYIGKTMYPIEFKNILSKVWIWWTNLEANVQDVTNSNTSPIDVDQNNVLNNETGSINSTEVATGISDIQDTNTEQMLPEINSWTTENLNTWVDYNPFAWDETVVNEAWDTQSTIDKLKQISEDSKWFMELGIRIKNTKIRTIWLTINKKTNSLIQDIESGTNIDTIQLDSEILKLETSLDKLKIIVNESPTSTWQSTDISPVSWSSQDTTSLSWEQTTRDSDTIE